MEVVDRTAKNRVTSAGGAIWRGQGGGGELAQSRWRLGRGRATLASYVFACKKTGAGERETGPRGEKEREDGGKWELVPSILGGGQARRVGAAWGRRTGTVAVEAWARQGDVGVLCLRAQEDKGGRERETGPGGEKEREDGGKGEPVPSVLGGGQARRVGAASLLVSHARARGNERHGRNSDGAGGKAARKERD
uniref:Uncharacterized protein n=1 Tax=Oryza nivara TaxID=4536 RepID=A0A0E0H461_ORYNI